MIERSTISKGPITHGFYDDVDKVKCCHKMTSTDREKRLLVAAAASQAPNDGTTPSKDEDGVM